MTQHFSKNFLSKTRSYLHQFSIKISVKMCRCLNSIKINVMLRYFKKVLSFKNDQSTKQRCNQKFKELLLTKESVSLKHSKVYHSSTQKCLTQLTSVWCGFSLCYHNVIQINFAFHLTTIKHTHKQVIITRAFHGL